jgi:hypothetical protein
MRPMDGRRRRRRDQLMRRAIAGALVLLGACGGGSGKGTEPSTTTPSTSRSLTGTVVMHGHNVLTLNGAGSDCGTPIGLGYPLRDSAPSAYDSWKAGAPVIVKDEHDTVIGSGTLNVGVATKVPSDLVDQAQFDCTFIFSVGDVPTTATFYGVTIGTGAAQMFSRDQVASSGWRLKIEVTP